MRLRPCSLIVAALLGLSLLLAARSEATPIGPNCDSCAGGVFDLTRSASPIATTATTETWEITYTADLASYDGGGSFLESVAIKVTGGTGFVIATLVSAPDALAKWQEVTGGINAFGCSGEGAGFECARDIPAADAAPVSGGPYTWVWHVEVLTGTLLTGIDQASIKARFVDGLGLKRGPLLSEAITLSVPEPGMALLLAGPLLLLGSRRRIRQP